MPQNKPFAIRASRVIYAMVGQVMKSVLLENTAIKQIRRGLILGVMCAKLGIFAVVKLQGANVPPGTTAMVQVDPMQQQVVSLAKVDIIVQMVLTDDLVPRGNLGTVRTTHRQPVAIPVKKDTRVQGLM